jgi:Ca-activated chloride channel family protein
MPAIHVPDVPGFTFLWPMLLWLLAAVPLFAILYAWRVVRRRRSAKQRAIVGMQPLAMRGWQRHLPPALLLLGLAAMLFAVARPQSMIALPSHVRTVILAMDMSGSMRATDIKPSRLAAAQAAAKKFIADTPRDVRIGLVSIAGSAALVQSPTTERDDIVQAIDRFQMQRGTSLGAGILISLSTLLPEAKIDVEKLMQGNLSDAAMKDASGRRDDDKAEPGSNTSAAIVLISDGESNVGPDPAKMAEVAARHGVRVYTIGVGTSEGATLSANGWSMRVKLDEKALQKVAATTGAEYFKADSALELGKVYQSLTARLVLEKKQVVEVTALFVALGAALAVASALMSLFWFSRIV